jgi:hypothetical protein
MAVEDVEDPSCNGLMGLKKISTTSVLETEKISLLTVPDGGVVLSSPQPTLGCSAHDDYDDAGTVGVATLGVGLSASCHMASRAFSSLDSESSVGVGKKGMFR